MVTPAARDECSQVNFKKKLEIIPMLDCPSKMKGTGLRVVTVDRGAFFSSHKYKFEGK